MSFWKRKPASRFEDGQPATAIGSSSAEAGPSEVTATTAAPVDIVDAERLPAFTPPPAGVSLGRSFCQDGFVVVPQVFNQAEVAELRRAAIAQFPNNRPPFQPNFSGTVLFQEPFRLVFRNRRFTQALREVLGDDFVFVNEFALHDSHYVGWHTDTVSPDGKGGHEFHWSPGFCVVQNAIYLQDNNENGGGLDVVPGSHMRDDTLAALLRRERGISVFNRMPDPADPLQGGVSLQGRAGDLVMFHFRLSHRASLSMREAQNDVDRKLALFMVAGVNNAPTRRYRAWLDEYAQMNSAAPPPAVPDDFRRFLSGIGHSVI